MVLIQNKNLRKENAKYEIKLEIIWLKHLEPDRRRTLFGHLTLLDVSKPSDWKLNCMRCCYRIRCTSYLMLCFLNQMQIPPTFEIHWTFEKSISRNRICRNLGIITWRKIKPTNVFTRLCLLTQEVQKSTIFCFIRRAILSTRKSRRYISKV